MDIIKQLATEFKLPNEYAVNIVELMDTDNTVPFIARYRKEMTGGADDQLLREFKDRLEYLRNLEKRKGEVRQSIIEQEKMTDELEKQLEKATTLAEVEDIYRPYKPKRRTRATIAVEAGLQGLADIILMQQPTSKSLEELAEGFINPEKNICTIDDALNGAKDIIAENVSDNAKIRARLKELIQNTGFVRVKAANEDNIGKYEQYKDYSEAVAKIPSHRILAVSRGEKEEFLRFGIELDEQKAINVCEHEFVLRASVFEATIRDAVRDGYNRLLFPSLEREIKSDLFLKAAEQAIKMFEMNLKPLLLQPPLKDKVVMGLDPGYRTGCKVAIVDGTGKVLDYTIVYPTHSENIAKKGKEELLSLIRKHGVEVIAIGNGTATKETEIFAADIIKSCSERVNYIVVNEAGASVYSASKLASEEFPDYDVTTRSAISIARRLQDPLAELIKIDPKSIGVGQYQHDMPESRLDAVLAGVVEDCVNSVGVDLNTASAPLLSKVAGLNAGAAKSIVEYRKNNGRFKSRTELLSVPKIGAKSFNQAVGFLRIPNAENVLDNTGVHTESYPQLYKIMEIFGLRQDELKEERLKELAEKIETDGYECVAKRAGMGIPTLTDIVREIKKPGRDIRDDLPKPILRADLMGIDDLKEGMILNGVVRNVIDFGVFVDIGVHQDGLVHISEIANRFIRHPLEVLSVGESVKVLVLGVDKQKNRISLSIKQAEQVIR